MQRRFDADSLSLACVILIEKVAVEGRQIRQPSIGESFLVNDVKVRVKDHEQTLVRSLIMSMLDWIGTSDHADLQAKINSFLPDWDSASLVSIGIRTWQYGGQYCRPSGREYL